MPLTDILAAVAVDLNCNACGRRYAVTLRQILLSQQAMHEGCLARFDSECPPVVYAPLLEGRLIDEFLQAWKRLEGAAHAAGGELSLDET